MDRITHQSPRQRGYGSTSSLRNDSLKHTRKHKRRKGGIEPRNKTLRLWRTVRPGGADRPHGPRRPSGLLPRTIRTHTADRPKKHTEPPETISNNGPSAGSTRTVSQAPADCTPSAADCPKPCPTKTQSHDGSKAKPSKNTKNTGRTRSSRTVRRTLADCPRLTDRPENSPTPKVSSPKSSSDFPNGRSCGDKGLGT
jgi:hypothetical protein